MKIYVNFTRVQTLLYYFACFIGLAPFSVENNILHPVGFLRKAYATILAILSSLWMIFVSYNRRAVDIEVTSVNKFVYTMVITLFVGNLCVTLLTFAFNSNKMIDIIDQMTAIKNELKNLGIEDNFEKNCKNFYARIIATSSVVVSLKIIIDFTTFQHNPNFSTTFVAIFWVGNVMTTIHSHSAILMFIESMICIRKLFESLNNKLQGTVKVNCNFFSSDDHRDSSVSRVGENRRIPDRVTLTIAPGSENIRLSVQDVEKIGKLHREVCDLLESTVHFHTLLLLFAIVRHFSHLLSTWYSIYAHVFISHDIFETMGGIMSWIQRLVCRTTITFLELFLIAHVSTSVSRVGNSTKVVLHQVWNKYYPEELWDELCKFSLQLLHKRVAVSAFGVIDLDYSYIYKIFCTLIAYFIIMIQFDSLQPNPGT